MRIAPSMAFVKVIIQFILAIEHSSTVRASAGEEGAVMLLHMTAVLSRTTESARAPIGALTRSSHIGMLDLVVDWRYGRSNRSLNAKLG